MADLEIPDAAVDVCIAAHDDAEAVNGDRRYAMRVGLAAAYPHLAAGQGGEQAGHDGSGVYRG